MLIEHKTRSELSDSDLDQCYKLVRVIRPLYVASGSGWSRKLKLQEFADCRLRFLLIRQQHAGDLQVPGPGPKAVAQSGQSGKVAGSVDVNTDRSGVSASTSTSTSRDKDIACQSVDKDKIAAFLSFIPYDESLDLPCVYIYEIHVSREFRGKGLGKLLMQHLEDQIMHHQDLQQNQQQKPWPKRMNLTVFDFNSQALRFYEKLGFEVVEEYPQHRLEMSKPL